jgi:hypothetical protein
MVVNSSQPVFWAVVSKYCHTLSGMADERRVAEIHERLTMTKSG